MVLKDNAQRTAVILVAVGLLSERQVPARVQRSVVESLGVETEIPLEMTSKDLTVLVQYRCLDGLLAVTPSLLSEVLTTLEQHAYRHMPGLLQQYCQFQGNVCSSDLEYGFPSLTGY
jgi:hypothetical protein